MASANDSIKVVNITGSVPDEMSGGEPDEAVNAAAQLAGVTAPSASGGYGEQGETDEEGDGTDDEEEDEEGEE